MHPPREVALERPQRFFAGLALGFSPRQVDARRCVDTRLGDRDAVQGQVELAIAFAVEAMALLFARGGIERGHTGELGELAIGAEATDTGHLGDQLGGGERAAARQARELRRMRLDERAQLTLELVSSA